MRRPVIRRDRALTADERMDAREALRLLEGSGLSLQDAARHCLSSGRAQRGVALVEIASAVHDFLASRRERKLRPDTLHYYQSVLERFEREVGNGADAHLSSINVDVVRNWIQGLPEGSRGPHWRALRAFLKWAYRQERPLIGEDWTQRISIQAARGDRSEIRYLSVGECRKLLNGVRENPAVLACTVLALFAGIRPYELTADRRPSLKWEHIDFEGQTIRIPETVAKARRPRVLEGLPSTLWNWLSQFEPGKGEIWLHRSRTFTEALKRSKAVEGDGWPQDILRHTFATMAVCAGQDLSLVSRWLGHIGDPRILHDHYAGLAPKKEAEAFWKLTPVHHPDSRPSGRR